MPSHIETAGKHAQETPGSESTPGSRTITPVILEKLPPSGHLRHLALR